MKPKGVCGGAGRVLLFCLFVCFFFHFYQFCFRYFEILLSSSSAFKLVITTLILNESPFFMWSYPMPDDTLFL